MSGNNINDGGVVQRVVAIKPEASGGSGGQTIQQEEPGQVQQSPAARAATTAQAVLVALETFITSELAQLNQTIASRTALINRLPVTIKEFVQHILDQAQAAQTTLPAGLVALLKSPKTAAEKLTLLATILEKAAGLGTKEGVRRAAPGTAPDKQQVINELVNAWRGKNPDELKAAAKVLRELSAAVKLSQQIPEQQAASGLRPNVLANKSQDRPVVIPQPSQSASETQDLPAAAGQAKGLLAEPEELLPPNVRRLSNPTPESELPELVQQQGSTPSKPQDGSAKPATIPGNVPVEQQDLEQLLKAITTRPELAKSLPPEVRELVHKILQQQTEAMRPAAQTPQVTQVSQLLQTGQVLQPALLERLASLIKSSSKSVQTPAEKLTLLANILEQAAALLGSQERPATQNTLVRQHGMAEMAEILEAWQGKNPAEIKAAAKIILELVETMPKPGGMITERQENQKVLTFTVPLYFGEGQTVYPAHIHVYHQEQEDKKNPGQTVTETWLRICLETENIGTVETAFRLYDEHNLDIKVRFTDKEAADSFADSVGEVKAQLEQLPLTLGEFLVK